MGLSDGRKSFRIGLAVLIQYRSVTDTQPASHVAVAITLNAQASSLKTDYSTQKFLSLHQLTALFFVLNLETEEGHVTTQTQDFMWYR